MSLLCDTLAPHTKRIKRYGWRPDLPDLRDRYRVTAPVVCPDVVNLRDDPAMPPVWDQGDLGSCTAHGAAACFEFALRKEGATDYTPSRLFLYYCERMLDGDITDDAGSTIRQSMKVLSTVGAPHEALWPYDIAKFQDEPPANVTEDAAKHRCIIYERIEPTFRAMQQAVAAGFPVTFGFTVYESFESDVVAQTGIMPMPAPTERAVGGHCVTAVGYDVRTRDRRVLRIRNSWGTDWGDGGYFTMPAEFFESGACDDCWTVRSVQG